LTSLDFVTDPSFNCPDDEAYDVAFVKATRAIGGRDAVEEYMAYVLFPLSKLVVPLLEFPVARRLEETNDGFRARVALATANVVGRYAHREHKVCVEMVLYGGWVNRGFEQAGVPYGPRLEFSFDAHKETVKKRKSDIGVRSFGKCAKVFGRKVMPAKAHVVPKGESAAPSRTVLAKATHATQVSKASIAPELVFVRGPWCPR
jgi:hypothetical protein